MVLAFANEDARRSSCFPMVHLVPHKRETHRSQPIARAATLPPFSEKQAFRVAVTFFTPSGLRLSLQRPVRIDMDCFV